MYHLYFFNNPVLLLLEKVYIRYNAYISQVFKRNMAQQVESNCCSLDSLLTLSGQAAVAAVRASA